MKRTQKGNKKKKEIKKMKIIKQGCSDPCKANLSTLFNIQTAHVLYTTQKFYWLLQKTTNDGMDDIYTIPVFTNQHKWYMGSCNGSDM